jgi:hypothetical protein
MNTRRYLSLFCDVVDKVMPAPTIPVLSRDVFDVLQDHREHLVSQAHQDRMDVDGKEINLPETNPRNAFPKELLRK